MRTYRSPSGQFTERPFFSPGEIETICNDELRRVALFPHTPEPIRIERFVEKRFDITLTYDDLPNGVLGYTRFGPKGVQAIVITKSLADSSSPPSERRLYTTIAHEAGHGLLHAHLFALAPASTESLFGDGLDSRRGILCRNDEIDGIGTERRSAPYRWCEYQANQAMAALLLPKALVEAAVAAHMVRRGQIGVQVLEASQREQAIRTLSSTFDVNPVVARLRLEALYPESRAQQLTL